MKQSRKKRLRVGILLLSIALIGGVMLLLCRIQNPPKKSPNYPKKSYYIDTSVEPFRVVWYEIPFGVHLLSWTHTRNATRLIIHFKGDFNPLSQAYQQCGFRLAIYDLNSDRAIWYGHNMYHTAIGMLEETEVALVKRRDGTVLAKGTIKFDSVNRTAEIVLPDPSFEPRNLVGYYVLSKKAFEEGCIGSPDIWERPSSVCLPFMFRSSRIPVNLVGGGQVKWKE